MAAPDASFLYEPDHPTSSPMLGLLSRYLRHYPHLVGTGTVAAMVSPLATLLPLYLVETVIDDVLLEEGTATIPLVPVRYVPDEAFQQLVLLAGTMIVLALVGAATAWIGAWTWGRFAQEVQHDVRVRAFDRVQSRELAFFEGEQSGQLVNILNDDINQLNQLLERRVGQSIELAVRFLGIVVLLLVLHWQLALVVVCIIPLLALVARCFVVRLAPKHAAVRQHVGALNARIQNALTRVAGIKAYGTEDRERSSLRAASRAVYRRRWDVIRTRAKFFPAMTTVNWAGFAGLLVIGGHWYLVGPPFGFSRELNVGTLVAFMLFSQQLTTPLVEAAQLVDEVYDSRASLVRIRSIMGEADPTSDRSTAVGWAPGGEIEVRDLSFRHEGDERPTIRSMSFTLPAGSFVGIVGATGSGKTTLAKLLLGLYRPDEGRVAVGGTEPYTLPPDRRRRLFGVVLQEPAMLAGTVGDNIAYARPDAEPAAIREAAGRAHADRFVRRLPDGYETQIGERGVKLSGGQRQRIALARALLTDAPVLVLDEATSHVDVETEAHIRRALLDRGNERTTIAIAHRLSTVRQADRILVLSDGELVESGTHESLLAENGRYARLWRLQRGELHDVAMPS